jgi:hypothetical protein
MSRIERVIKELDDLRDFYRRIGIHRSKQARSAWQPGHAPVKYYHRPQHRVDVECVEEADG